MPNRPGLSASRWSSSSCRYRLTQAYSNAKKAASLLSGGDKVMCPVLAGREWHASFIEVERERRLASGRHTASHWRGHQSAAGPARCHFLLTFPGRVLPGPGPGTRPHLSRRRIRLGP